MTPKQNFKAFVRQVHESAFYTRDPRVSVERLMTHYRHIDPDASAAELLEVEAEVRRILRVEA